MSVTSLFITEEYNASTEHNGLDIAEQPIKKTSWLIDSTFIASTA